jgi:mono/diheme cytochrome c family protein
MNSTSEKIGGVRGHQRLRAIALTMLGAGWLLSILAAAEPVPPVPAPRTTWEGVFNKDQVERGRKAYNSQCARCHGEALGGGEDSPALVDAVFFKGWADKSVGELVEYTRTEMPSDGPGKITRKRCTDITAFLLSANGFPSGETELPAELEILNQITITRKK